MKGFFGGGVLFYLEKFELLESNSFCNFNLLDFLFEAFFH